MNGYWLTFDGHIGLLNYCLLVRLKLSCLKDLEPRIEPPKIDSGKKTYIGPLPGSMRILLQPCHRGR